MSKRHVVITGTGRAGTTVLVKLLTLVGIDTGFSPHTWHQYFDETGRAGLETAPGMEAPYVVKGPVYCDVLDRWIAETGVTIDHVIVPTRDLYQAAESRRDVFRSTQNPTAPGGLWDTSKPESQEAVLEDKLRNLFGAIKKWGLPRTLIEFPRFAHEPDYLYQQLRSPFPYLPYGPFRDAFAKIVDTSLIHDYRKR